jgi:beta-xylosidase
MVSIDLAAHAGRTIPELVGFDALAFPLGSPEARDALRPLVPRTLRVDADIQHVVDCPAGTLNHGGLADLQARLDGVEDLGAEAILILAYMPPCLAAASPGDPRDPTILPAREPTRWETLIAELVAATGPGRVADGRRPVRYYEVWNEPDLPICFQGTPSEFVTNVMLPAGRAVTSVAGATGLDLRFGVCGCLTPDPAWMTPMFVAARAAEVPIDFVSWHYYTAIGPDGAEPGFGDALQLLAPLAEQPLNGPALIAAQAEEVRLLARSTLGRDPELIIDEWNISGGGFDRRHDTHEGAAFQAAGLAALAAAGIDRACLFNAVDKDDVAADGSQLPARYGGWGVLDRHLNRKPAWYAQWLWHQLGATGLASPQDPLQGIWTAAATNGPDVQILVAAYQPGGVTDRALTVAINGLVPGTYTADVYRIDDHHPGSTDPTETTTLTVPANGYAQLDLALAAQSVALARLTPAAVAGIPTDDTAADRAPIQERDTLPPTASGDR